MKDFLEEIVQKEDWIIEGVHWEEWVAPTFRKADEIVFLDSSYSVRTYRIFRRFILQKFGFEAAHYRPTFNIFLKMFKWNRHFEKIGRPHFYEKYLLHRDKFVVIKTSEELHNYINSR